MARPTRIELPASAYLLRTRAEDGASAFNDDHDRCQFLGVLAQAVHRFDAQVLAYALGQEGYELLLFTRRANLSRLMRHVNGLYTQSYNRRHGHGGAVFQGRFKAALVCRRTRLLEACLTVDAAPKRWGLVKKLGQWPWSSYGAHVGQEAAPAWLDVTGLQTFVLGRELTGTPERRRAAAAYAAMLEPSAPADAWQAVRSQVFLGDDAFIAQVQRQLTTPAAPAKASRSWRSWLKEAGERDLALYRAHTEGGLTMTALAAELGLSVSRVSRLVAACERRTLSPPAVDKRVRKSLRLPLSA